MKVVAKVKVPAPVIRVLKHLLKSRVTAIQDNSRRGLRVAVPFNGYWLRVSMSRNTETQLFTVMVEGLAEVNGVPLFEYSHTGPLNSAAELKQVLLRLFKKAVDELGTRAAEHLIAKMIRAIQQADVL